VRDSRDIETTRGILELSAQAVTGLDLVQEELCFRGVASNGLGLFDDANRFRSSTRVKDRGPARNKREVSDEEKRPGELFEPRRPIGEHDIGFSLEDGCLLDHFIFRVKDNNPHSRLGLSHPLRGGALEVTVKKHRAVAALVEPDGEMDRQRAFPDTTFGVDHSDEHSRELLATRPQLASFF
jgi:hypothetical protein